MNNVRLVQFQGVRSLFRHANGRRDAAHVLGIEHVDTPQSHHVILAGAVEHRPFSIGRSRILEQNDVMRLWVLKGEGNVQSHVQVNIVCLYIARRCHQIDRVFEPWNRVRDSRTA